MRTRWHASVYHPHTETDIQMGWMGDHWSDFQLCLERTALDWQAKHGLTPNQIYVVLTNQHHHFRLSASLASFRDMNYADTKALSKKQ